MSSPADGIGSSPFKQKLGAATSNNHASLSLKEAERGLTNKGHVRYSMLHLLPLVEVENGLDGIDLFNK